MLQMKNCHIMFIKQQINWNQFFFYFILCQALILGRSVQYALYIVFEFFSLLFFCQLFEHRPNNRKSFALDSLNLHKWVTASVA